MRPLLTRGTDQRGRARQFQVHAFVPMEFLSICIRGLCALAVVFVCLLPSTSRSKGLQKAMRRNIVIFVADGLRNGSVNPTDTPTMWMFRERGVYFANSHSLTPTATTPNASAIATGHALGDTKDFANAMYLGRPFTIEGDNAIRTVTPFLENDPILRQLIQDETTRYMQQPTLLELARRSGYDTAVVGKVGPVGIQDIRNLSGGAKGETCGIIMDDSTNVNAKGIPLDSNSPPLCESIAQELAAQGLPGRTPSRGDNGLVGGAKVPNWKQQAYFLAATTKVILPHFEKDEKSFVLVYWSRDPDGTQHLEGDSLDALRPGINGETSRRAVQNADNNLRQIYDFIESHRSFANNTDFFVTSDHGFATISRREIDSTLATTNSPAAILNNRTLPQGFLAMDLARDLKLSLFDANRPVDATANGDLFQRIASEQRQFLSDGNGLLGDHVRKPNGTDARAIVVANGGSDLIYVPNGDEKWVQTIVATLTGYDYVGGIFVSDEFLDSAHPLSGALPFSSVGLRGGAAPGTPAIVVAFKVFYLTPGDLQTAVQISDTPLREGQGMHGGFGRDSTFNNMVAIGPDFKAGFEDDLPVSNADIVPTLAHILHWNLENPSGALGRVLIESIAGTAPNVQAEKCLLISEGPPQKQTILEYQMVGGERYLDRASFEDAKGRTTGCSK
jgi:arylsulfatase A-like enzyme